METYGRTISKKLLLKAGYKEYETDKFQKRLDDKIGKKYFINVEKFAFDFASTNAINECWGAYISIATKMGFIQVEAVQWFNDGGKYTGRSIQDAERLFAKIWKDNGKYYYEKWITGKRHSR